MSGDPGGLTHEHRDLLFDLDGLPRLAERAVDPICGAESADGGAFGSIMMSCSTLAASGHVPEKLEQLLKIPLSSRRRRDAHRRRLDGQLLDETPTAVLIRQVLGAVAQFEKQALVAKLRKARERKRVATGKHGGRHSVAEATPETAACQVASALSHQRPPPLIAGDRGRVGGGGACDEQGHPLRRGVRRPHDRVRGVLAVSRVPAMGEVARPAFPATAPAPQRLWSRPCSPAMAATGISEDDKS
jgi:hypothetical protein